MRRSRLRIARRRDMATVTLYCKKCSAGYASLGEVPRVCPACEQETSWTTAMPMSSDPRVPYEVSLNDRRFLRSLRISPEE